MPAYRPPMDRDLQWDEVKNVHRYARFPKDLDGRMNAITSSLNNGMKVLMWSVGLSRSYRTSSQIRGYVQDAVRKTYVPNNSTFEAYSQQTMGPVGAIVQAEVRRGEGRWKKGFALTEEGERFRPVVDYSIKFFVDSCIDFHEVFGRAAAGAPKTRIKILKTLYIEGEKTRRELEEVCKLGGLAIQFHLEALNAAGLLEYESSTVHDGSHGYPYILTKSRDKISYLGGLNVENIKTGLEKIGGTPENPREFTYIDLAEACGLSEVSGKTAMTRLHKLGCVKPKKFLGGSIQSSINPTPKAFVFYNSWIDPVERALQTEELDGILVDLNSNYYFAVARSFLENSPTVNSISRNEGMLNIVSIINATPSITSREIKEKTGLGLLRVQQLTALAERQGLIKAVHSRDSKSVKRFYPIEV